MQCYQKESEIARLASHSIWTIFLNYTKKQHRTRTDDVSSLGVCKATSCLLQLSSRGPRWLIRVGLLQSLCSSPLEQQESQEPGLGAELGLWEGEVSFSIISLFSAQFQDLRDDIWSESELRGKSTVDGVNRTGWLWRQKTRSRCKKTFLQLPGSLPRAQGKKREGALWIFDLDGEWKESGSV